MKNREEQIAEVAYEKSVYHDAFIEGAKWADETNPKIQLLERKLELAMKALNLINEAHADINAHEALAEITALDGDTK